MGNNKNMAHPAPHQFLTALFQRYDFDRSGYLNEEELSRIFTSDFGRYGHITPETTEILIAMFDKTGVRQIDINSFQELMGYLRQWRHCYQSYDVDGTNTMDIAEVLTALAQLGHQLPPEFAPIAMAKFDLQKKGYFSFDDFVRIGVFLQSTSNTWYKFDVQRQGYAQLSFENLMEMALFSQGPVPPSQQQCMQPMQYQQMQPTINITIINNNTNENEKSDDEQGTPLYDCTEEDKEGIEKTERPHEDYQDDMEKWKVYPARIVTGSGKTIPGKTNLKKAWYGWGGKEYETGPFDKVFLLKSEFVTKESEDQCENAVGEGWFHCYAVPNGDEESKPKVTGPNPGKFRKGEGKCYYTAHGKEYETEFYAPIEVSEEGLVSLEELGIQLE